MSSCLDEQGAGGMDELVLALLVGKCAVVRLDNNTKTPKRAPHHVRSCPHPYSRDYPPKEKLGEVASVLIARIRSPLSCNWSHFPLSTELLQPLARVGVLDSAMCGLEPALLGVQG